MESKKEIGNAIKQKRLSLNLGMSTVADQVGITRSTLWSIENGKGNYTIDTLLKLFDLLNISMNISKTPAVSKRIRASRKNTALDKKINRFIVMCIEQYATEINKSSSYTYNLLNKNEILKELTEDYEDMHGMSTYLINEYIHNRLNGVRGKKTLLKD